MLFRGASPNGDDSIRRERDVGHAAHFLRSHGVWRLAFKSRDYLDRFARNYDFAVVAVDTIVWRQAMPPLMSIVSTRDGSLVVIPELPYSPIILSFVCAHRRYRHAAHFRKSQTELLRFQLDQKRDQDRAGSFP